jgi:PKD repeat protein
VVNISPEASFTFLPERSTINQPVFFDASASRDKDGTITSYAWDFDGDGMEDGHGEEIAWTFTEEGIFTIRLTVTDDDGNTAFHQEEITVTSTPPGPPCYGDLWAVVIGVGEYEDPDIRDSDLMRADAQAVYDFLVDRDLGGFPVDHVRLLLDEQATQQNIQSAFTWLMDMTQPDDLVIVYFAGHGSYARDRNGDEPEGDMLDEFLLPYDTDPDNLFVSAIRDDEVGDWVASMAGAQVVLIFDSCYAGGASRSRGYDQPTLRAGPGNTVFSDFSDTGLLVLAACQENETSKEDPSLGHGVFTYYLLRGLGGLADVDDAAADADQDGRVTIDELQTYLEEEVPRYVREVMRESPQNPLIAGDENLSRTALSGYGIPLIGEVTAIDGDRIIITLGSRHGLQTGDRFEIVHVLELPDGQTMEEYRGLVEVLYVVGPDRSVCVVVETLYLIELRDQARPTRE